MRLIASALPAASSWRAFQSNKGEGMFYYLKYMILFGAVCSVAASSIQEKIIIVDADYSIECSLLIFQTSVPTWKLVQPADIGGQKSVDAYKKFTCGAAAITAKNFNQLASKRSLIYPLSKGEDYVAQVILNDFRGKSFFWSQKLNPVSSSPLVIKLPECVDVRMMLRGFSRHSWVTNGESWFLSLASDQPCDVNYVLLDILKDSVTVDGDIMDFPPVPLFSGSYRLCLRKEGSRLAIPLGKINIEGKVIKCNGVEINGGVVSISISDLPEMSIIKEPHFPSWEY